ncbi:hypothetical protein GCM10009555_058140 [Acrocarpospora macrocephala]|uniref:Periplasmic binding protein domain-containing protein n=1 Tax=Acrocarpospora macrocephala TaxID=150177 RepID=A0A5M3WUT6_9ACTN|nr:substrate-binding domain-containing protein [Acrocarpospora macrocephala]GES11962.1 hypothetical protein Amac_055590 [Acrocarpospora macrocephala]
MSTVTSDRARLLRDLLIALVSGLILAVGGGIYSAMALPSLTSSVPFWLIISSTATVAGTAFAFARYRNRGRLQAFILVSAFAQKHWVAELLENLIRSLERNGIDLVLKIPPYEYSGHGQVQQLAGIRRKSQSFVGGFVMAADRTATRADFESFCRDVKIPIVFIDSSPFDHAREYPSNVAFVGCDSAEIGDKAAKWLVKAIGDRGIGSPGVLVIASTEHPDRQNAFVARFQAAFPSAQITVNDQAMYDRKRSSEIVDQHLDRVGIEGGTVHAIFCTNDEMALGAVDTIQRRAAAGNGPGDLVVVGVDATREAVATIDSGGTAFRATVVQGSRQVAELAVSTLLKLRAGDRVEVATMVPTTIHPIGNASSAVPGSRVAGKTFPSALHTGGLAGDVAPAPP